MDDSETLTRRPTPAEIFRNLKERSAPARMPEPERNGSMPPATAGEPERFDPEGTDYTAWGWAGNHPVPSLRFIRKDGSEIGASYSHLDTLYPGGCEFTPSASGKGNVITLRFTGSQGGLVVTLEGRHLRRLWELVLGHQTAWIHEYPGDLDTLGRGEPVVKAIRFQAVDEPGGR